MRFRLQLQPTNNHKVLPINYQYELSSWVYRTIHTGNPEFALWLHDHGYMNGRKQFKYFTFSNLIVEKVRISGDRLELVSNSCFMDISFFLENAVENRLKGVCKLNMNNFLCFTHFRIFEQPGKPAGITLDQHRKSVVL